MTSFKCGEGVDYRFGTDDAPPRYSGKGKTSQDWLYDYSDKITWAEINQQREATAEMKAEADRITENIFEAVPYSVFDGFLTAKDIQSIFYLDDLVSNNDEYQ